MPEPLLIIICIVISAGITYLVCHYLPQQKIKEKNYELEIEEQQTKNNIQSLKTKQVLHEQQLANLESKKELVSKSIQEIEKLQTELRAKADSDAKNYFNDQLGKMKYLLQKEEEVLSSRYENFKAEYDYEYDQMLSDYVEKFKEKDQELTTEEAKLADLVREYRAKADAIVEVNRRAELEKSQKDFYRIVLSNQDIEEIQRLRSVLPYLRDKEPLNKVIYKVYYEKPLLAMIGRVLGPNKICGIYKITNLDDGKCYVGQSTNVAERWRQHVKRGTGAEAPTNNKLYPILYAVGVENFMFELIEECLPEQLNEREKYYQEVFHAQDYGYSIK